MNRIQRARKCLNKKSLNCYNVQKPSNLCKNHQFPNQIQWSTNKVCGPFSLSHVFQEPQSPEDEVESDVILNINGVNCYSLIGNERSLIATGTLQLLKLRDNDNMHILKLDEFEFPLTKSIPCLRSSRGYFMVPMPGNIFYGFVFPK